MFLIDVCESEGFDRDHGASATSLAALAKVTRPPEEGI
jgi:hypothetical protein